MNSYNKVEGSDIMNDKEEKMLESTIKEDGFMSEVDSVMKKDARNRKKLLRDVEKDLASHSQKLVAYDRVAKDHKLLQVKYDSIKKEFSEFEKQKLEIISQLQEGVNSLQQENQLLKRVMVKQKKKLLGLQSIVELIVNDYGLNNIEIVTGLSADKIKEYLEK